MKLCHVTCGGKISGRGGRCGALRHQLGKTMSCALAVWTPVAHITRIPVQVVFPLTEDDRSGVRPRVTVGTHGSSRCVFRRLFRLIKVCVQGVLSALRGSQQPGRWGIAAWDATRIHKNDRATRMK